jgi:hypothetical protein
MAKELYEAGEKNGVMMILFLIKFFHWDHLWKLDVYQELIIN